MNVEIKKDGFVYVDGGKVAEYSIKDIIEENVALEVEIKWVNEENDDDLRVEAVCGVNRMEVGDMSDYVSG